MLFLNIWPLITHHNIIYVNLALLKISWNFTFSYEKRIKVKLNLPISQ